MIGEWLGTSAGEAAPTVQMGGSEVLREVVAVVLETTGNISVLSGGRPNPDLLRGVRDAELLGATGSG